MHSALTAWRELAPPSPHGLVWTTPDGGPIYYKVDDAEWYALQEAAGVQHPNGRHFTIHEARHTTATLLLEAGVAPEVIIAILGHSSILTSRSYMHVNQAPAREALEKVAERLQLG
jgi:integrase